ncbi:NTP pyrophosphatase (non-canonical NTP hydrolase) [Rhizobium rosettiformans]|uniref:Uncharacterized protein n=2 Tax=Rhizobium rosettiformans TaxID=1368430 RepID=A0A4S8PIY4_9HYPH|nr:hypothetical protein [Rhizobium rosettiformans]MBB5278683.1 NTP pyrophosphatase (non-canonical NTP hydrolase) [Rhizobium rosettiformans]THV29951.1 hypothetical protein FAA86_23100 [Rhizobium rosettiformans W3]
MSSFQDSVAAWTVDCFGEEIAQSTDERNHRFLEEALELVQACGATKEECHALVDYVFSRETGELEQEIGGVMVCLASLAAVHKVSMEACADTELLRIDNEETKAKIRQKHALKPNFGGIAAAARWFKEPLRTLKGDVIFASVKIPG